MSSLFGVELPTPVNFVIAFVVVLALIGALAWLVRRFGATRLDASARSRQPRLAVIDAAAVDGRRKLVIIRRDNVEHLLMIGGPTDVVVETNIVRVAAATTRDTPVARNGAPDGLARPIPLPDPTPWPLQPEPAQAPPPAARPPRSIADDPAHWQSPNEAPPPRATRTADSLADLANEFPRPIPEVVATPRVVHPEPVQPVASAMSAAAQVQVPDQSLAEMAQRLEAALRRPMAQGASAKSAPESAGARVVVAAEHKAARAEPKAAVQIKGGGAQPKTQAQNASLEQEMASLLGRPGKT